VAAATGYPELIVGAFCIPIAAVATASSRRTVLGVGPPLGGPAAAIQLVRGRQPPALLPSPALPARGAGASDPLIESEWLEDQLDRAGGAAYT
jgi:hypothetical protein